MTRNCMRNHRVVGMLAALGLAAAAPAFAGHTAADVQHGQTIFNETCVACHGANGKGVVPGTPDMTKAHGVLSLPESLLEQRVENGFQSSGSPMAMPARGGNPSLTDQDVKDVLAYMRQTFEHH